ncbi:hypothetical protein Tco_1001239 [Tanacetum coccineum]
MPYARTMIKDEERNSMYMCVKFHGFLSRRRRGEALRFYREVLNWREASSTSNLNSQETRQVSDQHMAKDEENDQCEFLRLQAGCNLKESEEKTAAMYITVLSQSIQDELKLLPIWTIDQSHNLAMKVERSMSKQALNFEETLEGKCDECPNRKLNAYVWEHYGGDTKIDFGDDLEHIDKFAQVEGEVVNLMVQHTLCATNIKDFPQRNKIFETKYLIEDHVCSLITNGGSYENLVSKEIVKAMKLPTQQHPKSSSYHDEMSCDVMDLGASHLLLGRTWRHDVDAIHRGKNNSFFVFNWFGKNIAILLNGRPPDLKTLFVRLLVEDGESSRASSFQVRGNDMTRFLM